MSDRKSGRARKSVNYKAFACDGDEDNDDDFADSTPPVSKKRKLSTNKENNTDKPPKLKKESKQPRKSLEERQYERELQAVLELSLTQSGESSQEAPVAVTTSDEPKEGDKGQTDRKKDEESGPPSPVLPTIDNPPVLPKISDLVAASHNNQEEIEILESSVNEAPRKRTATGKKKYVESDSEPEDFEVDLRRFLRSPLTPKVSRTRKGTRQSDNDSDFAMHGGASSESDSTDEYNEDSDSDFGSSKKKTKNNKKPGKVIDSTDEYNDDSDSDFGSSIKKTKNNKKPVITSTPKPAQSKAKPKTAKSVKAPTKPSTAVTSVKSPAANPGLHPSGVKPSPGLGARSPATVPKSVTKVPGVSPGSRTPTPCLTGRKPPAWKAPGPQDSGRSPLGGVSIKSPSTGILRVGLSRNIRLKPLHSNIKTHN